MDPQWLSPSPQMWRARRWVLGVVAAIVILLLGLAIGFPLGLVAGLAAAAGVAVVAALVGLLLWRRYRAWGYAEREDDLLVRRGVMIRRLTVVPYGRMQFVDVTAGPVDRHNKLGEYLQSVAVVENNKISAGRCAGGPTSKNRMSFTFTCGSQCPCHRSRICRLRGWHERWPRERVSRDSCS